MPRPNQGPRLLAKPNAAGFYEISITQSGRSRRYSTGKKERGEAQKYFARWLLELDTVAEQEDRAEREGLTVQHVVDHYVREHVAFLPLEASRRRIPARLALVCAVLGDRPVRGLGKEEVRLYVRRRGEGMVTGGGLDHRTGKPRLGAKALPSSCRGDLAQLVAAIRFAAEDGLLPAADAPRLKLPDAAEPRPHYLTPADAERLLAASAPRGGERLSRAYRLIFLGLTTAARMEAMQQLTWDRVDFDNGMIDFNKPGRVITRKRRVKLPMSEGLRAMLLRAHEERTGPYVLDHDGQCNVTFRCAVRRAGLTVPKGAGVHLLRHSWATWQAQRGQSMTFIASVLGDTVQTTERYYAKHSPQTLQHVVNDTPLAVLNGARA